MMSIRLAIVWSVGLLGLFALGACAKPVLGPTLLTGHETVGPLPVAWDWAQCLHDVVRDGCVRYDRLSANPAPLDRVLIRLSGEDPPQDATSRKAYGINAYNAFALRAGLERYRTDLVDPNQVRAPREDEYRFRLHGSEITLAELRDRLVDQGEPDPRILLALCPARVGIPLWPEPIDRHRLDGQLDEIAAAAMKSPDVVRVDHEKMVLRINETLHRNREMLVAWYERRTGAQNAALLNALLDLCQAEDRYRLNTAIGYPVSVLPRRNRLNLTTPAKPE